MKGQIRSSARRLGHRLQWIVAIALVALAACIDEPTRPGARNAGDDTRGPAPRTLGLVEITISGLGSGQVRSSAIGAATVEELDRLRAMHDAAGDGNTGVAVSAADPGARFAFSRPSNSDETGNGSIQLEPV